MSNGDSAVVLVSDDPPRGGAATSRDPACGSVELEYCGVAPRAGGADSVVDVRGCPAGRPSCTGTLVKLAVFAGCTSGACQPEPLVGTAPLDSRPAGGMRVDGGDKAEPAPPNGGVTPGTSSTGSCPGIAGTEAGGVELVVPSHAVFGAVGTEPTFGIASTGTASIPGALGIGALGIVSILGVLAPSGDHAVLRPGTVPVRCVAIDRAGCGIVVEAV